MNEHMKISEETIKEMKRTVKEVIRTLGMEINSGRMEAHEKEFIYGLELRTGYGWRILRTRVTLEANGKTRIWATSYRPAPIGSREESEDEEPDGGPDGAQERCSGALGQGRRTDKEVPRICMRMHEGG